MGQPKIMRAFRAAATALMFTAGLAQADVVASTSTDPTHSIGSLFVSVMGQEHSGMRAVSPLRLSALGSPYTGQGLDQTGSVAPYSAAELDAMGARPWRAPMAMFDRGAVF